MYARTIHAVVSTAAPWAYDYAAASGLEVGRRRAIAILREIKSVKFKREIVCSIRGVSIKF